MDWGVNGQGSAVRVAERIATCKGMLNRQAASGRASGLRPVNGELNLSQCDSTLHSTPASLVYMYDLYFDHLEAHEIIKVHGGFVEAWRTTHIAGSNC
jgi:hypothetical protein